MNFSLRAFKKKVGELGRAAIKDFSMRKFKRKSSDADMLEAQPRRSPRKLQKKWSKDRAVVNIQEDPYAKSDEGAETDSTETFPFLRLATIDEQDDEVMVGPESDIEDNLPDAASSIYSEDNTPLLSDAVLSLYTAGAEELDVINVRRAILDYTATKNNLTNEQVAEIQDEMNFLRFSLASDENLSMEAFGHEDNQLESSRQKNIPEVNPSSYQLSHCSTPDTDDSSNEILSRVSSYFTARTSPSLQEESGDVSTGLIYSSSIDEAEEASRKDRSRHSSISFQTSKSSPTRLPEPSETISIQVKAPENISTSRRALQLSSQPQSLLEQLLPIPGSFPVDKTIVPIQIETSEEINSSYSRTSASLFSLRDCSSTEELPSPASPTAQTTCLHEPEAMPQPSRRPFSLGEAIEIDNYCEKRKKGQSRGQQWMDQFWGFGSLQMLFVWKYGWKPEVERFEDFWLRREEQTDFWLLWDYPTNLV